MEVSLAAGEERPRLHVVSTWCAEVKYSRMHAPNVNINQESVVYVHHSTRSHSQLALALANPRDYKSNAPILEEAVLIGQSLQLVICFGLSRVVLHLHCFGLCFQVLNFVLQPLGCLGKLISPTQHKSMGCS